MYHYSFLKIPCAWKVCDLTAIHIVNMKTCIVPSSAFFQKKKISTFTHTVRPKRRNRPRRNLLTPNNKGQHASRYHAALLSSRDPLLNWNKSISFSVHPTPSLLLVFSSHTPSLSLSFLNKTHTHTFSALTILLVFFFLESHARRSLLHHVLQHSGRHRRPQQLPTLSLLTLLRQVRHQPAPPAPQQQLVPAVQGRLQNDSAERSDISKTYSRSNFERSRSRSKGYSGGCGVSVRRR